MRVCYMSERPDLIVNDDIGVSTDWTGVPTYLVSSLKMKQSVEVAVTSV